MVLPKLPYRAPVFLLLTMLVTLATTPARPQRPALPTPATTAACPAADPTAPDPTYPIRKLAFDALTADNQPEARRLMRCALRANPDDLVALRQIVYLDLNAGDEDAAIEDIDSLRAHHAATPTFEAQQGYIFFHQRRLPQARAAFARAAATGDALTRGQALRSIRVIDAEYPARALELSLDAQYLNRFNDGIVDASARYFQRLGAQSPVRAYASARLLRDTASQVGPLPQIFSDNALMGGLGLAFQPHLAHYFLSAEANIAYVPYSGRNNTAATVPDFRTIAGYYNVFHPGAGSPYRRFSAEANGSAGFYSRYGRDFIAYLQPQLNFDLLPTAPARLALFFQPNFAFDSNRQFYNNTAELIPGLQLSLPRLPGTALRAEFVHGIYLPAASPSLNPYGSSYNDFRIRLTFDRSFLFHSHEAAP